MKPGLTWRAALVTLVALLHATGVAADEVRVAVASNFKEAAELVSRRFEAETGHKVVLSSSSTGKHYAQIKYGAPFDVLLAADARRPQLLESQGLALEGSRFTYAIGRIVLWSSRDGVVDPDGTVLRAGTFEHLAIANPALAPYGEAARQVIAARGLTAVLESKLVLGENISQAYQFVSSGNAELGFVALSQLERSGQEGRGSMWDVPTTLYEPIEQQAVLLKSAPAAEAFLEFMKSEAARTIIRTCGYSVPQR